MATNIIPGSLNDDIYLGFWINRSFDTIRGATLTLDRNRGGLLIAFLALFVSTSGRSLWKIFRCLLHFAQSTEGSNGGVHVQRQAILRNTPLPLDAAYDLILVLCAWRTRGSRLIRQLLLPTTIALLLAVGFIFAGIFSSRVSSSAANEVLLRGRDCGTDLPEMQEMDSWQFTTPYLNQKAAENLAYAQQCYQTKDHERPDSCGITTIPALPYTIEGNATCPFSEEMCKGPSGNFLLDTGVVDSHKHLGLNMGPHVTLQVKEHCAPLVTRGFSNSSVDPERFNVDFTRYYYGGGIFNYTFEVANDALSSTSEKVGDYEVFAINEQTVAHRWTPELGKSNAVTTLYFLVPSGVAYLNRTEDPWFSANTPFNTTLPLYVPDSPASVLGCTSERRFCNPNIPGPEGCLDLFGSGDGEDEFRRIFPDTDERLFLRPLNVVLQTWGAGGMPSFYKAKSVPTLLARQTLLPLTPNNHNTGIQTKALPSNQWQKEMVYVAQASLSSIQHFVIDYARGSWFGGGSACEQEACRRTCYSQKARSSKHYSFSVLGVGIILALGGLFMLSGFLLEPVLAAVFKLHWFQDNQKLRYAYAEWQAGSTLQIQRLAHESLGVGTWSNATGTVPITQADEKLATLDISDLSHARLRRCSVELDKVGDTHEPVQKSGLLPHYSRLPSTEHM